MLFDFGTGKSLYSTLNVSPLIHLLRTRHCNFVGLRVYSLDKGSNERM